MPCIPPGQLLAASEDSSQTTGPTPATRTRGMGLMVLGPLIALMGAATLIAFGPMLLRGPSGRETGPSGQDVAALLVMVWLLGFGVLGTIGGWQLWKHGRYSRKLGYPLAAMVLGFLASVPWLKQLFA